MTNNGVPQDNITAQGYGATNFVADNGNSAGRAQNRRVELVVSGQAIGVPTTTGRSTPGTEPPVSTVTRAAGTLVRVPG